VTGSRYERQLVNALTESGYPAIRVPPSGSVTDRSLPDVLAGKRSERGFAGETETLSETWAIELKTTSSKTTSYADELEVEQLGSFAYDLGALPLIAAGFKRPGGEQSCFYLVQPTDCRTTDGCQYGAPISDAGERAISIVEPATEAEPAGVVDVA
jgi:Holliday junction resolvase